MISNKRLVSVSEVRPRTLTFLAAAASIVCGAIAIVGEGSWRLAFGAAAIVLAATAAFCASAAWFDSFGAPDVDFEAPPPEPAVPQSEVTLIHDPGVPPNNALQATRDDARA